MRCPSVAHGVQRLGHWQCMTHSDTAHAAGSGLVPDPVAAKVAARQTEEVTGS